MGLMSKIKNVLSGNGTENHPNAQAAITINHRSDGLTATGIPHFVNPDISEHPTSLLCHENTTLKLSPVSSMITGASRYRSYILQMQIVSALRNGYTPVVLSADGKQGEAYSVLSRFYLPGGIDYISDSADSGYYNPYEGVCLDEISDFFSDLISESQQPEQDKQAMIRSYMNVCVRVCFSNEIALGKLIGGQLNHMELLRLIGEMDISAQEKRALAFSANQSQSVKVEVLGFFQNYLHTLRHTWQSSVTPSLRLNDMPRITVHRVRGNGTSSGRIVIRNDDYRRQQDVARVSLGTRTNGFGLLSSVEKKKCLFLHISNEISQNPKRSFQWYLAKALQWEKKMADEENVPLRNTKILVVIEELNAKLLNWYKWLIALPNSIVLLSYKDFHSKISDDPTLRSELIGLMERVFFFSVMDNDSVKWTSEFFGSRTVPKIVRTDLPPTDWYEWFIRKQTIAHDEQMKPWFSEHEIRHLGDTGIVFSKDQKFTACYLENGRTYEDRSYRGKINFSTFSFK